MATSKNRRASETTRPGTFSAGPLHTRRYTDMSGRVWSYDPASLGNDGQACFRFTEREASTTEDGERVEVFGPALTHEDQLPQWAARLEASEETRHRTIRTHTSFPIDRRTPDAG